MNKIRGTLALEKILREETDPDAPGWVADYGCGFKQPHRPHFEAAGWKWFGYDLDGWVDDETPREVDCVWASHVLEHLHSPVEWLKNWRERLSPDGVLAVTVPLRKDEIVGGHINLYNAGLLIYQAVLAGFDCSAAAVRTYGQEVSLIVRKPSKPIRLPELKHDAGDLETLAHLFPPGCGRQGFDGMIERLNW